MMQNQQREAGNRPSSKGRLRNLKRRERLPNLMQGQRLPNLMREQTTR
jgi:hypothetical protein